MPIPSPPRPASDPDQHGGIIKLFSPMPGPAPNVAGLTIDGHPFEVRGWTMAQWEALAEKDRPADAFRVGEMGYLWIVPVGRSG